MTRTRISGLEPATRSLLERWARSRTLPVRVVVRSRIVLAIDDGLSKRTVAERLGLSRNTVDLWQRRFVEGGAHALTIEKPGRGRKPGAFASTESSRRRRAARDREGRGR